jgi:hypothetical protein
MLEFPASSLGVAVVFCFGFIDAAGVTLRRLSWLLV